MKIALINSEYPSLSSADQGGIATYTITMAKALAELGHTVHLLVRTGTRTDDIPKTIAVHPFGFRNSTSRVKRLFSRLLPRLNSWELGQARAAAAVLCTIHARTGLDIVEYPEYGGLAAKYKLSGAVPLVITFHTPSVLVDELNHATPQRQQQLRYALEEQGVKKASGYRSPSEALKKYVCRRYTLSEKIVSVIRNPLDATPFGTIEPRPSDKTRFDILFTGRLERRKGAELLLQTLGSILAIDPAISVTFAGETDMRESDSYRLAIERQLTAEERKRVWFLGPIPRARLLPLYRHSSLFLFPSTFENAPYALMEAMAAGLPVVAAATGGIPEMIFHNTSGLLFNPHCTTELIEHITTLFSNHALAETLTVRAVNWVQEHCSPEKVARQSVAFYKQVLSGG